MSADWLILAYTLPPEPSRKRVAAWRRLRRLGAVYLNEGFWFLPESPSLLSAIGAEAREIEAEGGTAWAFRAQNLVEQEKTELAHLYNAAREDDYAEVVHQCEKFLMHVEREMETGNFAFAMMEELEQDLEKRVRWLSEVQERDVLHTPGREVAEGQVQQCREALERFSEAAFHHAREAEAAKSGVEGEPD